MALAVSLLFLWVLQWQSECENADFLTSFFLCFLPILLVYYPVFMAGVSEAKAGDLTAYCRLGRQYSRGRLGVSGFFAALYVDESEVIRSLNLVSTWHRFVLHRK